MNIALLILDAQNDFFAADNPNLPAFQKTVPVINAAIAVFRQQKRPFCFIQHYSTKKPAGSHSRQIEDAFNYRSEDWTLQKRFPNAFWQTDLEKKLRAQHIDTVLIAGYLSEFCVLSTYRGAQERGFKAWILSSGIATLSDEHTPFVLNITQQMTLDKLSNLQEVTMQGKPLIPGTAAGQALVLAEPLSLWGGLDPETGLIIDKRHPNVGELVTGKVLVLPAGRGSSSASSILLEAVRQQKAPAAIITAETDGILALGAAVARELYNKTVPILVLQQSDYAQLKSGQWVAVGENGRVSVDA